jgi:DNA-binding CsgD family transcriptional regulator
MYLNESRLAEAEAAYREGAALCERADVATYGYCLAGAQAETLLAFGRFEKARAMALELLGSPVSAANRVGLCTTVGIVLARTANHSAAAEYLDQARANVDATGEAGWVVEIYPSLAEAGWLRGDLEAAARDATVAVESLDGASPWTAGNVVTWARRLGVAVSVPDRLPAPHALNLDGDHEAAAHAWDLLGNPYQAALARYDAQTDESLREAIRRFEALGATAAVDVARNAMRSLGLKSVPSGPRSATREHPLGLTRREREVLDLVCAGCTNTEISEALTISARTVEHHISAVLGKLGAPNRTAAAVEAARLGLVGPDFAKMGTAAGKPG